MFSNQTKLTSKLAAMMIPDTSGGLGMMPDFFLFHVDFLAKYYVLSAICGSRKQENWERQKIWF